MYTYLSSILTPSRSFQSTNPVSAHLSLVISEINTYKRELRKRHRDYLYKSLKKRYNSKKYNEIIR